LVSSNAPALEPPQLQQQQQQKQNYAPMPKKPSPLSSKKEEKVQPASTMSSFKKKSNMADEMPVRRARKASETEVLSTKLGIASAMSSEPSAATAQAPMAEAAASGGATPNDLMSSIAAMSAAEKQRAQEALRAKLNLQRAASMQKTAKK
jgi:hypothetical protein